MNGQRTCPGGLEMNPTQTVIELSLAIIEELEAKVSPDRAETVPLPTGHKR